MLPTPPLCSTTCEHSSHNPNRRLVLVLMSDEMERKKKRERERKGKKRKGKEQAIAYCQLCLRCWELKQGPPVSRRPHLPDLVPERGRAQGMEGRIRIYIYMCVSVCMYRLAIALGFVVTFAAEELVGT